MKKFHIFLLMMLACNACAATETINWYVDGSVYDTTTCQTGGNVSAPTQPTKYGYTFTGWETALYNFSTLDYTTNGTDFAYNASANTWTTTFNYGDVSGVSLCSDTFGSWATAGIPDESTSGGKYCWCKATGYAPSGGNVVYESASNSAWVVLSDLGDSSASACASGCAYNCGAHVKGTPRFRQTVFQTEHSYYDFSTLDASVDGNSYTYDASANTWTTVFNYGIINGISLCSDTPGTWATAGTPNESTSGGQYCWCKATSYTPANSTSINEPTASLSWVFFSDHGSADLCASGCAYNCGYLVRNDSGYRRPAFGAQ